MIDVSHERLITLSEAARLIPGRPHASTIWRWRTRGVKGRKLESVTIGGKAYTSREALQRFAVASGGTEPEPPTLRTPKARERAIAKAEKELSDAGI